MSFMSHGSATPVISRWHCWPYFFMCEPSELPLCCLLQQINHIVYDAAGDIVLFPHFWDGSPVSTPCLSSSFKSIYCSHKSIRLSEERCRFKGHGSLLLHFLPNTHTHRKAYDVHGAWMVVIWWQRGRSHTFENTKGKLNLFPRSVKSMYAASQFLS